MNEIASGDGYVYGGGLSLWFARDDRKKYKLQFTDCKFYDIINNNSGQPYNQGGAIQYGYSSSISNVSMVFQSCEFRRNKCTKTGSRGGAIGLNINHDIIVSDCIFDSNSVRNFGGAIYISGSIFDSITGSEKECEMNSIRITGCEFINNVAQTAAAFYTYADNINHVKLNINSCSFIDNKGTIASFHALSSDCKDVEFFNTTINYINIPPGGLFRLNQIENINFTYCKFANCISSYGEKAISLSYKLYSEWMTTIKQSLFLNCKSEDLYAISLRGKCEIDSTNFVFDDIYDSCGAIEFKTKGFILRNCTFIRTNSNCALKYIEGENADEIIFTNCTFDNCFGDDFRLFEINLNTPSFTFSKNIIKNMVAINDPNKAKTYFGKILWTNTNYKITFVLEENVFLNNSCASLFGGGTGLWIKNAETVEFNKCQFIDNEEHISILNRPNTPTGNGEENYKSGDGGAIQFGFSEELYKTNLVFNECLFKNNKAPRHGGAIALQIVGTADIIKCRFEGNIANYKQTSSTLLEWSNYYSWKKEGRGGAIYINPAFKHIWSDGSLYMLRINIDSCEFINNYAFDGHAIYIEGDNPNTNFSITNNKFIDNYDNNNLSPYQSIITSEIPGIFDKESFISNDFKYTDPNIKISPIIYVDHYASAFPSQPPIYTKDITPEQPDDAELEVINVTTFGRYEYIITDDSRTIIYIVISQFINIATTNDNGGALHISNAGLVCNFTLFLNCSTKYGIGGAIYYNNTLTVSNFATLIKNNVTRCEAQIGGGFFIYSSNKNNRVTIKYCTFAENEVHKEKNGNEKYGGSGIYVSTRKGRIKENYFINNIGPGSTLMIDNNFKEKSSLLLDVDEPLFVSECYFETQQKSDSGVFLLNGKNGNFVELSNCTFKGNNFIDDKSIFNDSHKMIVINCKIIVKESSSQIPDSNLSSALMNEKTINLKINDQKKMAVIVIAVSASTTLIIIFGFLIFIKKKNHFKMVSINDI